MYLSFKLQTLNNDIKFVNHVLHLHLLRRKQFYKSISLLVFLYKYEFVASDKKMIQMKPNKYSMTNSSLLTLNKSMIVVFKENKKCGV